MRTDIVIGLISNIREKSAHFINDQLKNKNANDLINSYGTILSILYDNNGKISLNLIGKLTGKKKSTLTDMIKKLVTLGYIIREKSEIDKRSIEISLTKKGWDFQPIFKEISYNLLEKAYSGFSQEEKELLITLLQRVRKNFKE